ncbi:hypothetical protein ACA910_003341 [Epithemia clementina (nom. ined.)]
MTGHYQSSSNNSNKNNNKNNNNNNNDKNNNNENNNNNNDEIQPLPQDVVGSQGGGGAPRIMRRRRNDAGVSSSSSSSSTFSSAIAATAAAASTSPTITTTTTTGLATTTPPSPTQPPLPPSSSSSCLAWDTKPAARAVGATTTTPATSTTRGTSTPTTPTPMETLTAETRAQLAELRVRARKHMDDAIQGMPMEQKQEYLEAMQKAPYLFESETDQLQFLRRCDYDIRQASHRLCLYWKERKALFGPDRAFLPLTLTGDGALTKDDVLSLQAGFPALLPETTDGRAVAYCDRRQFVPSLAADNRLRTLFYLVRILAEDERAQVEGVVMLILLVTPARVQEIDCAFVRKAFDLLVNAMPIKVKFHILNFPPKAATSAQSILKQYKVQDLILSYISNIMDVGLNFAEDMSMHFERDDGDLYQFMETELHMTKAGIPFTYGGDWNFVECINWSRKQALLEREQYKWTLMAANKSKKCANKASSSSPGGGNLKEIGSTASLTAETTTAASAAAKTAATSLTPAEEEQQRLSKKRANNVIQSRRKRERQRQELVSLTNECQQLQREKDLLQAQHRRLQSLWEKAQRHVPGWNDPKTSSSFPTPTTLPSPLRPVSSSFTSSGGRCGGWNGHTTTEPSSSSFHDSEEGDHVVCASNYVSSSSSSCKTSHGGRRHPPLKKRKTDSSDETDYHNNAREEASR